MVLVNSHFFHVQEIQRINFFMYHCKKITLKQVELNKSKENIAGMFDSIAKRYDFLNHLLSLRLDVYWRKRLIKFLKIEPNTQLLDVACGTGDVAIAATKKNAKQIVGIDISDKMLAIARIKADKLKINNTLVFQNADAAALPFDSDCFNAISCAFGVRNFQQSDNSIAEFYRVLSKQGILAILEFSIPKNKIIKSLYLVYFRYFLPNIGRLFSRNRQAYNYLNVSVEDFEKTDILSIMQKYGFTKTNKIKMTMGVVTIYSGIKE